MIRIKSEKSRGKLLSGLSLKLKKKKNTVSNLDLIFYFLSKIKQDQDLFSNLLVVWKLMVENRSSDLVYY